MKKEDPVPVYFNLSYGIHAEESLTEDEFYEFVVDFKFSEIPNKQVSLYIEEDGFLVLQRIAQTNEIPQYKNIANIFYLLRGTDAEMKSAFLSENEDEEIDIRATILIPQKAVVIINFDIVTGLCLTQILGIPISITQELFNKLAEDKDGQ